MKKVRHFLEHFENALYWGTIAQKHVVLTDISKFSFMVGHRKLNNSVVEYAPAFPRYMIIL